MGKQISGWVQILERVTEHRSARKYGRKKSQKSKFPYIYYLYKFCSKLYVSPTYLHHKNYML